MILRKKLQNKSAIVGVIGLGYVGLPLILSIDKKRYDVLGFDIDQKKINNLKKGKSNISDITPKKLRKIDKKKFKSLKDIYLINKCDVIIICLPTPLKKNSSPDMSYLEKIFRSIKKHLRKNQLLILESTVYPGVTDKIFVRNIEKKFILGKEFFVAYSPERVNPGDNKDILTITKIISGKTPECLKHINIFYKKIFNKVYKTNNIQTAEFAKLYENSFRSVNISFVNQMKMICDKLKINIHEVIETCKTKPFGFTPFYPGPGMGGHCIPIDPLFISWIAKKKNVSSEFIENSRKVNYEITNWIINKINSYLKKFNQQKVLLLGITYKKNINDTRESPGLKMLNYFKKKGIKIEYFDPFVPKIKTNDFIYKSIKKINYSDLSNYTAIIICSDHDVFDYSKILKFSKMIFDTRGIFSNKKNVINC